MKPTKGNITVFNKDIVSDFRYTRSKIGIAPQEISNDWFFSVEQLLYFQAGFYGIERKNAKERIEYILHKVGLYDHKDKKMRQLSGGMKRRLQIARALANDPEILILDEPTAGINPTLINGIIDRLIKVNKEFGITLLVIEHNMRVIMNLAQKIFCLAHGELLAEGLPEQIKNDKRVIEAYLGAR